MNNEIIIFDDCAKVLLKNNEGAVVGQAIIDIDDVGRVKKQKWHMTYNNYVIGYNYEDGTKMLLHTFIKGAKPGHIIDHINGNTLDNRKSNLRHLTYSENNLFGRLSKRNKTGKKGVHLVKLKNGKVKYSATIQHQGKVYNLGRYDTLSEAVRVRQDAEIKLIGVKLPC